MHEAGTLINPKELLRAGRLSEARTRLVEEVKAVPGDSTKRTLLFQVLSFLGEWDKAERHLDTLAAGDPKSETGVQVYRNLIAAERERLDVVAGRRRPAFMTGTPPWLELHLLAWEKLTAGDVKGAGELYGQVEAQSSAVSGTFDGRPFTGFRDADVLLSSFLEVFIHERYLWIPFSSLRELTLTAPKTLLDTLWAPARFVTWEGLTTACYLPVLYPETAYSGDDRLRMGRMTDWREMGGGFYRGIGQHVLLVGDEEMGILDVREVRFNLEGKE